jgi:hypothetical protein
MALALVLSFFCLVSYGTGTGTSIILSGRTSDKQETHATLKNKQNNHPIRSNGSFRLKFDQRNTQHQRETSYKQLQKQGRGSATTPQNKTQQLTHI